MNNKPAACFARRSPSHFTPTSKADLAIFTPEKCLELKQGFNDVYSTLGQVLEYTKCLLTSPVLSSNSLSLVPSKTTSSKLNLPPSKIFQYHQNTNRIIPYIVPPSPVFLPSSPPFHSPSFFTFPTTYIPLAHIPFHTPLTCIPYHSPSTELQNSPSLTSIETDSPSTISNKTPTRPKRPRR